MDDFTNYLNEQLKNKEFKEEWDKLELRYQFVRKLITLREENKISQAELAKKSRNHPVRYFKDRKRER